MGAHRAFLRHQGILPASAKRARVWGCPGYVLSHTLQDGKKIPKWAPKARRGQFLGVSKQHSSMIGHMRDLQTGYISPQFHVVYDELFTTVHSVEEDDHTWIELFLGERNYYRPDEEAEDSDTIAFPSIDPVWEEHSHTSAAPSLSPIASLSPATPIITESYTSTLPATLDESSDDLPFSGTIPPTEDPPDPHDDEAIAHSNLDDVPTRRRCVPNPLFFGDEWSNHRVQVTPSSRTLLGRIAPELTHGDLFLHSLDWDLPFSGEYATFGSLNLFHVDPDTNEVEWTHPFSLEAKASNADPPTLRDIQRLTPFEIEDWYDAMDIELAALRAKSTMTEIPSSSVPSGKQINKST